MCGNGIHFSEGLIRSLNNRSTVLSALDIATLLGSLAALGSVWFGFFSWKKSQLAELFRGARPEMIEIVQNFKRVTTLFGADSFFSLDQKAAQEIEFRISFVQIGEDLASRLSEDEVKKSLNRAAISAFKSSSALKEAEALISRNRGLAARNRQVFPVVCEIADDLCSFAEFGLHTVSNSGHVFDLLSDPSNSAGLAQFRQRLAKANTQRAAAVVVAELYTDYSAQLSQQVVRQLTSANVLLESITQSLMSRDDPDLRMAMKEMSRISKSNPVLPDASSYTKDIINKANTLQPLFEGAVWIDLVRKITELKVVSENK